MRTDPSFLRAFYYGNIEPQARNYQGSPVQPLLKRVVQAEETLLSTMTPEQKALFEQYQKAENDLMTEHEVSCFQVGFRLGGQCIHDVFVTDREVYIR